MKLILSCISTRYSQLKAHWSNADRLSVHNEAIQGSLEKPKIDLGGMICQLDHSGIITVQLDAPMPAGMIRTENGLMFAGRTAIHSTSLALDTIETNVLTSPLFNALHTIRASQRGYLVTSTGLDLILEIAPDGHILWQWWAVDHGLNTTPFGHCRTIDRTLDHRGREYGTLMQTTHVNSAVELPTGQIVATLFHQGAVILIEREDGRWRPLIEELPCVHGVRRVDDQHITVADTQRGRGLLLRVGQGQAKVVDVVRIQTDWLQDCVYIPEQDLWILVDGSHSKVLQIDRRNSRGEPQVIPLDPEWRLYEVLPA